MNREQFEIEMIEYIQKSYFEFTKYQGVVNDILKIFDCLCQEHEIPYYVAFGSLLGLIRDNGNIPWDYDIDVVVPIDFREKLIKCLDTYMPEGYYYVYNNKTVHYPTCCLRVCKKGFTYMAFHVDVFFLFGTPDNENEQKKFYKKIEWLYNARRAHNGRYHVLPTKRPRIIRLLGKILIWIKYPISNKAITQEENKIYFKYPLTNAKRCMVFYPLNLTYSTAAFGTPLRYQIKDGTYNVPKNSQLFLRERYGDYNTYLPIRDRFNEFYNMYEIIEERQDFYLKCLRNKVES